MTDWQPVAPESWETGSGPERKGGWVVLGLVAVLALLFGGGYAAAYYAADNKVPRGTTVAGVEIGGLTQAQAENALRAGLEVRAAAPIDLVVAGDPVTLDPAEAGLAVDYAASIAAAGIERSWSPSRLWDYFTGGDDLDAVVTVDEATMTDLAGRLTEEHGNPPRDGAVSFRGAQVKVREALAGRSIKRDQLEEQLTAAFLDEEASPEVDLSLEEPGITASEVDAVVADFANPAVSGPVILRLGRSKVTLPVARLTGALSVEAVDGELVPTVDRAALRDVVDGVVSTRGAPVDATVRLVNGRPRVVPAKPGVTYRLSDVTDVILGLVTQPPGERKARVRARVKAPELTTKDAQALKIKEKVSTFTTYYPYAEYRNVNIGRAAVLVNGTVLKPGDTFSLNDTVGERTRENGFTEGFIISNGIFKEDLGGGVSQMATTIFNAMFFAGLEDIEHKPHSFYIDRYPIGREATVAWGSVDLRFKNDTPYGVLVQAKVTPATGSSSGVVTVSMWSTKYWDITTRTGERYNLTSPQTRTLRTEECYPNQGYGGFDIDIWRYFRKPGKSALVRAEKMHTTYTPSDTVICRPPRG